MDVSPVHTASQCFHVKGVPTFRLQCNNRALIKVHQAFYGVPPRNTTCQYAAEEQHCVQMTELRETCMGRSLCAVYVSNPFLINCHMYATYKQVNYTCIPRKLFVCYLKSFMWCKMMQVIHQDSNHINIQLYQIDGWVQERHNSTANALESCISCINRSKCNCTLANLWHPCVMDF